MLIPWKISAFSEIRVHLQEQGVPSMQKGEIDMSVKMQTTRIWTENPVFAKTSGNYA